MRDPYEILGVSRTATRNEIRNAYRKLAKQLHPDMKPGDREAQRRFQEASAAYEILGDEEKRKKWDAGLWEDGGTPPPGGFRPAGGHPGEGFHFSFDEGLDQELFEQLFGGRAGGRGRDVAYRLEVGLREAVLGGARELVMPDGKRLRVKIPAGVVPGQRLRFAGQGAPGRRGAASGDAYVELVLAPDPRFELEGANLLHDLDVPLDVAVLGGELPVPTPEGGVMLTVPPHSSSGRRLRVPGKGLFARSGGRRGDLVVRVRVALPKHADPALDAAIRAWKRKAA